MANRSSFSRADYARSPALGLADPFGFVCTFLNLPKVGNMYVLYANPRFFVFVFLCIMVVVVHDVFVLVNGCF